MGGVAPHGGAALEAGEQACAAGGREVVAYRIDARVWDVEVATEVEFQTRGACADDGDQHFDPSAQPEIVVVPGHVVGVEVDQMGCPGACGGGAADDEAAEESECHGDFLAVGHAEAEEEGEGEDGGDDVEDEADHADVVDCFAFVEAFPVEAGVLLVEAQALPVAFPVDVKRIAGEADGDDGDDEVNYVEGDGCPEDVDEAG